MMNYQQYTKIVDQLVAGEPVSDDALADAASYYPITAQEIEILHALDSRPQHTWHWPAHAELWRRNV